MEATQQQWHEVSESDIPCWVKDLDTHLTSVDHRRLCVWQDELTGKWAWEVETYSGTGEAGQGDADSLLDAQRAAEQSIRL